MAATNNITGDEIKTKANSSAYQANYDLIDWSKKEEDIVEKNAISGVQKLQLTNPPSI